MQLLQDRLQYFSGDQQQILRLRSDSCPTGWTKLLLTAGVGGWTPNTYLSGASRSGGGWGGLACEAAALLARSSLT